MDVYRFWVVGSLAGRDLEILLPPVPAILGAPYLLARTNRRAGTSRPKAGLAGRHRRDPGCRNGREHRRRGRDLGPLQVFGVLTDRDSSEASVIDWSLRIPRTVIGLSVGVALGVAGALMQGHTRNPLADPGLLGVSAGAALAVVPGRPRSARLWPGPRSRLC